MSQRVGPVGPGKPSVVTRSAMALAAVSLAWSLVMAGGCATQDPDVRNTLGNVTGSMRATPPELIAATERALRQMEMEIRASQVTEHDGRVSARTSRGRAVDVRVFEGTDDVNRVSVRVGAFGDTDASRGILRRIERELERGGFDLDDEPAPDDDATAHATATGAR